MAMTAKHIWTEEELLQLANDIGGLVEKGILPAKDENGFYIL